MDFCLLIRQRLDDLEFGQKDLAAAAGVTESYVSQLLNRRKMPPSSKQSDIYERFASFLQLPVQKLVMLAEQQRLEERKKRLDDLASPLVGAVRELILRKCSSPGEAQIRPIFEKQSFGELERLVTQKLLDVAKQLLSEELEDEDWVRRAAVASGMNYEQMRVTILEFLETDVFDLSQENCVSFLNPLIESWSVDLATFGVDIVLNRRLAGGHRKRFEFVVTESDRPFEEESGLTEFLREPTMSGDVSAEEVEFLRRLSFRGRRPTALYYYRELQNLRDPLHFDSE